MSAAIAALLGALAVVYSLSITTTSTEPIDTLLSVLINFINGRSRVLTANDAMTALFYIVVVCVVVFSASFFILRFLAMFLAAFGWPDEQRLRLNREVRRGRGPHIALSRRQARQTALFTVRAQQAAIAAQRRKQAQSGTGQLRPLNDPTPRDFNLK